MQDMMLLAIRHKSSVETFKEYMKMRADFRTIGPKPTGFNGQIGSTFLTQQEVEQYKPYTIPMNNLALGLEVGLDKDMALARQVVAKFGPVCQRYFNDHKFVSLTFPSDAELADMIAPPDTSGLPG